jgi:hypothetical protein
VQTEQIPTSIEIAEQVCTTTSADYVMLWFPRGAENGRCFFVSNLERVQIIQALHDQIKRLDRLGMALVEPSIDQEIT